MSCAGQFCYDCVRHQTFRTSPVSLQSPVPSIFSMIKLYSSRPAAAVPACFASLIMNAPFLGRARAQIFTVALPVALSAYREREATPPPPQPAAAGVAAASAGPAAAAAGSRRGGSRPHRARFAFRPFRRLAAGCANPPVSLGESAAACRGFSNYLRAPWLSVLVSSFVARVVSC